MTPIERSAGQRRAFLTKSSVPWPTSIRSPPCQLPGGGGGRRPRRRRWPGRRRARGRRGGRGRPALGVDRHLPRHPFEPGGIPRSSPVAAGEHPEEPVGRGGRVEVEGEGQPRPHGEVRARLVVGVPADPRVGRSGPGTGVLVDHAEDLVVEQPGPGPSTARPSPLGPAGGRPRRPGATPRWRRSRSGRRAGRRWWRRDRRG